MVTDINNQDPDNEQEKELEDKFEKLTSHYYYRHQTSSQSKVDFNHKFGDRNDEPKTSHEQFNYDKLYRKIRKIEDEQDAQNSRFRKFKDFPSNLNHMKIEVENLQKISQNNTDDISNGF